MKAEAGAAAKAMAAQLVPLQARVADIGAALADLLDGVGVEMDDNTHMVARRFNRAPDAWQLPSETKERWRETVDRLAKDPAAQLPRV